jgi:hypothetical protein
MIQRTLRIVKLTPIAVSTCASCGADFHSHEPVEDDAEAQMRSAFDRHKCRTPREEQNQG